MIAHVRCKRKTINQYTVQSPKAEQVKVLCMLGKHVNSRG